MANVLCVSHEWNLGFEELRALADVGFRVIAAASGLEAVKQFAAREINAIVVNRRLPDIDVNELVSFFRHQDRGIPIVMLSTVMPMQSAPAMVDAVIHKHGCAALLPPTLQVLLASRSPRPEVPEGDGALPQAA